jgi:4-diphosphocytidyl-2-C-methyl-D-erythritol kinase
MISFPNAKINIGLYITSKRTDGYHNLETVFYPIPLKDVLEVVTTSNDKASEGCNLYLYGNKVEGDVNDNLVVKAYRLLRKDYTMPSVDIHLYKKIPSGAGLGGGSADAAYMLRLLNELFELNISKEKLQSYAIELGADCPIFIQNVPSFAEGIGEILSPISVSLSGYKLIIVKPNIYISTREAFANIKPKSPRYNLHESIKRPIEEWKDIIANDFEASIFPRHPELADIKNTLYSQGAVYASMSGSGSSLYGIFPNDIKPDKEVFKNMFYSEMTID